MASIVIKFRGFPIAKNVDISIIPAFFQYRKQHWHYITQALFVAGIHDSLKYGSDSLLELVRVKVCGKRGDHIHREKVARCACLFCNVSMAI